MAAARASHNIKPFKSYILGGFECSTHRRRDGCRLDLVEATKHDIKSTEDYRSLLGCQIYTARDGIRWHLAQAQSDHYDWRSFLPMLRSARESGIQVIWDLAHYGYPDWLDIWDKNFVHHYEKWARAVACLVKEETDEIPSYVPINEISYWSWAGGTEGYMNPFATDRTPQLREILVRAAIAGIEALWSVDPRACIIHAEPVTHMVPASESLADYHKSQFFNEEQFRAWDMISGLEAPLLGGLPRYLGILGVNFYPHNEATTERAVIDRNDNRYKPFSKILLEVHNRYKRPLFVSETGVEGDERVEWFRYICDQVELASLAGVPVTGICLYPILSFPEWENQRFCEYGLFSYGGDGERKIYEPLAGELLHQQQRFL